MSKEFTNQEISFIKSILSTEGSRDLFINIFNKFIDELKDIETLNKENLEQDLKTRLVAIEKLNEIINKILVLSSNKWEDNRFQNI